MAARNTEVLKHAEREFEKLQANPGPIGDPEVFMQRFRVTPGKYRAEEVIEYVEMSTLIFYITDKYFFGDSE